MKQKFSALTDHELLNEAKKMKSTSIFNAVFIGVLFGIAIYSTVKNGLGFFTFLPLLIAYKIHNDSNKSKVLNEVLHERNLK